MPETIRVVMGSRLAWLDVVQGLGEDLGRRLGLAEDDRFAVAMAVREALNNAILHGNQRDETRRVDVEFQVHTDRLEVRIKDEGPGFDAGNLPDPLAPQNLLRSHGRGIFLIRSYMDEVDLERAALRGGEVRMVKWLPGSGPPQAVADRAKANREPGSH